MAGLIATPSVRRALQLPVAPTDRIYTHGPSGEYGHPAHQAVHRLVADVFASNDVFVFSSGTITERFNDPVLLQQKRRIFRECYRTQQSTWSLLRGQMDRLMFEWEGHLRVGRKAGNNSKAKGLPSDR